MCCNIFFKLKKEFTMNYIENLKKIRLSRGMSQMAVAAVLEINQQQYCRYENGQNEIPVRHIITLCKFYGISADWLLGLKEEHSDND